MWGVIYHCLPACFFSFFVAGRGQSAADQPNNLAGGQSLL